MSDACQELITGLFETLTGSTELTNLLGAAKIFDRVPDRVESPYVVIGRTTTTDYSTASEDGVAIVFFVHCWSQSADRGEIHAIQQLISTLLTDQPPVLATHNLIHLRNQFSEVQRDHLRGLMHGLTRFRAVVEPKS
ncbi:MAG: DUF3168 domain-containing protein [Rhizobiaceae bacterium]